MIFEEDSPAPIDDEWRLSARVENFGKGPAILEGGIVLPFGQDPSTGPSPIWKNEVPFRAGESRNQGFGGLLDEPATGESLTLFIYYRSASGAKYATQHRLRVGKRNDVSRLDVTRMPLSTL